MNKPHAAIPAILVLVLAIGSVAANAASFDPLLPLLVDLPGWEAEPAGGWDASASGARAITVFRSYEGENRHFEVNVLIGMQAGMSWMPEYREGFKVESSEGSMEVRRINGFLVFLSFDQADSSGGILVLLNDPGSKPEMGAVMAISFEGLGLEEALKNAQRFNWAKMKDQIARLK